MEKLPTPPGRRILDMILRFTQESHRTESLDTRRPYGFWLRDDGYIDASWSSGNDGLFARRTPVIDGEKSACHGKVCSESFTAESSIFAQFEVAIDKPAGVSFAGKWAVYQVLLDYKVRYRTHEEDEFEKPTRQTPWQLLNSEQLEECYSLLEQAVR